MVSAVRAATAGRGATVLNLSASLPSGEYNSSTAAPNTASITFHSNGTWTSTGFNPSNPGGVGTWLTGDGTGANYWVDWDNTSGASQPSTPRQLDVDRTYDVSANTPGASQQSVGNVTISSDATETNVLATSTITLTAFYET